MIHWNAKITEAARRVVPPLTKFIHKGEMGRIGILGGSEEYTGAPYYAAKAALMLGRPFS